MSDVDAGDVVRANGADFDMLVIGRADDPGEDLVNEPSVFCVWERAHFLNEKIFRVCDLVIVRKERRRVPRYGSLNYPTC